MNLEEHLQKASKAELQGLYLHWFPGEEIHSVRDKLRAGLLEVMTDPHRVRERFDALPRAQQAFIVSLLIREECSSTVEQVRAHKHGRVIEDFEVELVLKSLQEAGYIAKTAGSGGYASEVFSIPEELAAALRRTISVEDRNPLDMLSLNGGLRAGDNGRPPDVETLPIEEVKRRIDSLEDSSLESLVRQALDSYAGILFHAEVADGALNQARWRQKLEEARLGTTGVLSLKDYGIDVETECLTVYQEVVLGHNLERAARATPDFDRELSMGVDLIIDLDRALEVLRRESLEITREGNVYKKIEDRIAEHFVTSQQPEFHEGSPVAHILELCRKLQFFEEEPQKITLDPLRRRVWRTRPLLEKVSRIFELYRNENRGQRWSFHQRDLRDHFLECLKEYRPGEWLVARPFLSAMINRYLLSLEESCVASAYQERCTEDFRNETLVVSLTKLYRDLSFWVVHRLALLGVVDLGYRDGSFHALRLSRLGKRLFERLQAGEEEPASGSPKRPSRAQTTAALSPAVACPVPVPESDRAKLLVNPDFEVLVFPEVPEETSWLMSFIADRIDSDRVKRYRLSRESVKRGVVAGLSPEEVLHFLETNTRGAVPPNVLFSLKEWTDGVEVVRRQKAVLLRAASAAGADRLVEILERHEVPLERLNETTLMVRGGKHERAVEQLREHFRDCGLFVE